MIYDPKFEGWNALTIHDLLVAYRKAKADCFYENAFPTSIKFAEYERDLLANLDALLEILKQGNFSKHDSLLGQCRLIPKKLTFSQKATSLKGHAHFSDAERSFSNLQANYTLSPEFRVVGDFPVEAHVISALWINMIGHKFDACLDDACYGSRLRRIQSEEQLDKKAPKPFHIAAHTSFEPYYQPYKRWRQDGLNAIRSELAQDRKVVAVSMDLRSYYHQIDPSFFSSRRFQKSLGLVGTDELTAPERTFTTQLARFLRRWADEASSFAGNLQERVHRVDGGLVIGLTATRIISNVLLHLWDDLVRERITPVHYGRYIDDMFLVLHDPGTIGSMLDLMRFLRDRLGASILIDSEQGLGRWEIQLGKAIQKDSRIQLQAGKQKLFILEGQAGQDLVDSIEKEIVELSSERRLMPSPDQLEKTTAARVLSAAGDVAEQADTLRRADGLTIRRLSWSLQLMHVETLARDLPASAWKNQRMDFYSFAEHHILRPDRIFSHYNYLPRLLGFAIGMGEWSQADRIVRQSFEAISKLRKACSGGAIEINGTASRASSDLWRYINGSLAWAFIDAAAKNYPTELLFSERPSKKVRKLAETFMEHLWEQLTSLEDLLQFDVNSGNFHDKAPLLASSDLGRTPYKIMLDSIEIEGLLKGIDRKAERRILRTFAGIGLLDTEALKEFLNTTRPARLAKRATGKRKPDGYRPYLFPTRPYTPSEIAVLDPRCVGIGKLDGRQPQEIWAQHVRALRGVWVKPTLLETTEANASPSRTSPSNRVLTIGNRRKSKVGVAITNLGTSDASWAATAADRPRLTLKRYRQISELVNQAIRLDPRPDYLVFPELSLPLKWIESVTSKLTASGISLIGGTEYCHTPKGRIYSQVCLHLTDDRLGFPTSVRIFQPKLEPAVSEDRELISKFGLEWHEFSSRRKPVYKHNDVCFGVMVCSELQNTKARTKFQGYVDALFVLSWNKDLDTFSALVEATALDIHAYTILVNNRRFGDSRVRSPAKKSFERDIARLRGGKNDYCVAVDLDIQSLRAFQSRAKRWPSSSDSFKPVPEGFRVSGVRRVLPPR